MKILLRYKLQHHYEVVVVFIFDQMLLESFLKLFSDRGEVGRESPVGSTPSAEPDMGLDLTTLEIMT